MRSMLKTSAAALAFFATATGGAFADGLTGDLKIFLGYIQPGSSGDDGKDDCRFSGRKSGSQH
jgi:hypothetical protein